MVSTKLIGFLPAGSLAFLNKFNGSLPPQQWNLVPDDLKNWDGWLLKHGKRPYSLNANGDRNYQGWQLPQNQKSYQELIDDSHALGIATRDGLICLDFDDVIDPDGNLTEPIVRDVLDRYPTHVTFSSSGTGVHIWFWTDDPDLQIATKLTFRSNGKSGEWLGKSFVAYTGFPHPDFRKHPVRKLSIDDGEWLKEKLIPISNGYKPAPTTTTPTTREPDISTEPFGIKWKPSHISRVRSLMEWKQPIGMKDTSHSGWSRQWSRAYMLGAESQDMDQAVNLSIRFEGFFDKSAPSGIRYQRKKHSRSWHEREVLNAVQYAKNLGRLVFLGKGEKQGVTPAEEQLVQASRHVSSSKLKPATKAIYLSIVVLAKGRDRVRITNQQLATHSGCDRSTVIRAKTELYRHKCLDIDANFYTLKLNEPCG